MRTVHSSILLGFTAVLITLAYPAFAEQDTASPPKNELGISLLSYASPPSSNIWSDQTFYAHPLRGVSYKRHFGHSAVRLAVARQQLSKRQPVPNIMFSEGDYEATIIKVGWERSFSSGRLSPYAAADLMGIRSSAVGALGGGIVANCREFVTNRRGLGLSPTLGLRYRPLRWLSVFAETSLDIIYARYQSNYTQTWPEVTNPNYTVNMTVFEGKFNPLSTLVINVTF